MLDRLSVSKKVEEKIIPNIDSKKFLGLDKSTSERTDLFLFAMSLGIAKGIKKELANKVGVILATSVKLYPMSVIFSVLVDDLRKRNENEKIANQDEAFIVAQEYANAGFEDIHYMLEKDEDALTWEMLSILDEKYENLFFE